MGNSKNLPKRLIKTINLRTECFRLIYEVFKRPNSTFELSFDEIEERLHTPRKTTLKICQDLKNLFDLELSTYRGNIRLGHKFYYQEQMLKDIVQKEAISERFVAELEKHRVNGLACSPGTTVTECTIKLLPRKNLYREIITNNLSIKDLLDGETHNACIIAGGLVNRDINATLGIDACEAFDRAKCDCGLIGVSGLDEDGSLYLQYYEEIEVLSHMAHSILKRIYIVAAIEKLTKEDTHKFCSIKDLLKRSELEVCIITTHPENLKGDHEKRNRAEKVIKKLQDINKKRIELIVAPLKAHEE